MQVISRGLRTIARGNQSIRCMGGYWDMKKNIVGLISILLVISLTACGNKPEVPEETAQNVQTEQEATGIEQETDRMEDDLPRQQGEISQSVQTDMYEYEGEYLDYDGNEPALEIKKNSDGTYQIQITIYRLCFLEDGIGRKTEKGLEFAATGPNGNEMNGVIHLEDDVS